MPPAPPWTAQKVQYKSLRVAGQGRAPAPSAVGVRTGFADPDDSSRCKVV